MARGRGERQQAARAPRRCSPTSSSAPATSDGGGGGGTGALDPARPRAARAAPRCRRQPPPAAAPSRRPSSPRSRRTRATTSSRSATTSARSRSTCEMPGVAGRGARRLRDGGQRLRPRRPGVAAGAAAPDDLEPRRRGARGGPLGDESARARLEGREPPERRSPCFFDPRHGPSSRDVEWAPPGGAPRMVPACEADAQRVERGEDPETREVTRRRPADAVLGRRADVRAVHGRLLRRRASCRGC